MRGCVTKNMFYELSIFMNQLKKLEREENEPRVGKPGKLVTIGKSQINVRSGVGGKGVDGQFNRQLPSNH